MITREEFVAHIDSLLSHFFLTRPGDPNALPDAQQEHERLHAELDAYMATVDTPDLDRRVDLADAWMKENGIVVICDLPMKSLADN